MRFAFCPGGGMVDAHVSGACVERHAGSSPVLGTNLVMSCEFESHFLHQITIAEIAQLVEHNLAKVRVASSSLVFRSKREIGLRWFLFFYVRPKKNCGVKEKSKLNLFFLSGIQYICHAK